MRSGTLAKSLFYGDLSVVALSFVAGPRAESAKEPQWTARVLELPFGTWLVGAVGAALIGYGLWNGYRSVSGKFRKDIKTGQMDKETSWWLYAVAFLGHAARMALFGLIGVFFVRAAYQYDPSEAGRPRRRAREARPAVLRWLVARLSGRRLIAYGVFSLFQARYGAV